MSLDELPGVAEVAMQSGWHAGSEIRALIEEPDRAARPFRFRDLGSAAYVSRGQGLVRKGPFHLSGFLGWLAWGGIHIAFLSGTRNRLSTLASWLWTLLLRRRAELALISAGPGEPLDDGAAHPRSDRAS